MVDPRTELGRSLPGCGCTDIPVLGTSPWQRGEQEERMGILTVGGASGWRGSDGWALAKGGGGGANSTTRGSGHEGGERGADLSAVKMAGGVAPFYRVREAVEGTGGGAVRGTAGGASSTLVMGVEVRGRPFDEVEMKGRGRRFNSTPTGCGWATDGGVQSGGKPVGWAAAARAGGGRRPRDGPNGPKWVMLAGLRLGRRWNLQRNSGWAAMAIGRIDGLNRRTYRKCF
jgi:hypothetical protein